jgi:sialic acid synthase SpsE
MIDSIKAIDTGKHEIILKAQLSLPDGINLPLDHDVFDYMYHYGNEQGYKVTSSVADLESLKFLLQYDIPFVKLPNCRELDWLMGEILRKVPIYISVGNLVEKNIISQKENVTILCCVSEYPADIKKYEYLFTDCVLCNVISDHTIGLELYKKYQPLIWEKHYKLPDSTGLDAGPFAITPEELREIL